MANFQATLAKQAPPGPTDNVRVLLSSTVPSTLCCSKITRWPRERGVAPYGQEKDSPPSLYRELGKTKGVVCINRMSLYNAQHFITAITKPRRRESRETGNANEYPKCNTKGCYKISTIHGNLREIQA
jgi:hypothetical protein